MEVVVVVKQYTDVDLVDDTEQNTEEARSSKGSRKRP